MVNIAVVGTGGFAREVMSMLENINAVTPQYNILGFVDKSTDIVINGYPVIGDDETINQTTEPISLVIAVGDPWLKEKIRNKYTNTLVSFPTIIHPSALIQSKDTVKIGDGCIICAGTIITCNIEIKDFVTLNLSCTVGHDTVISDYCSFMPSVNISGEINLENKVYVGTGAKIIQQLTIGENTIVGAGAVVVKSLPANCTAVGVPAKPIKFRESLLSRKNG